MRLLERDRMRSQLLKEAARLGDQEVDIAGEPVGGDLVLHQPQIRSTGLT
jgi:hypothetical protein